MLPGAQLELLAASCTGAPLAECRQCRGTAARRGFCHCSRSRRRVADAAGTALGRAVVTSILPGVGFWLSGHLDHLWEAKTGVNIVTVHRKEAAYDDLLGL